MWSVGNGQLGVGGTLKAPPSPAAPATSHDGEDPARSTLPANAFENLDATALWSLDAKAKVLEGELHLWALHDVATAQLRVHHGIRALVGRIEMMGRQWHGC